MEEKESNKTAQVVMAEKVESNEPPTEQKKEIVPPTATDCTKITADVRVHKEGYFDYPYENGIPTEDTLRYPFTYIKLPWGRIKQIRKDAIILTEDCPELEETTFQGLVMDEMILTIANQSWKQFAENQVEGDFAEAFRQFLFPGHSDFRIPSAIQKKLIEELTSSVVQSKPQAERKRRTKLL